MSQAYSVPPKKADEILKLIAKTASGRKLLESFLPLLAKGAASRGGVTIEPYPAEIVSNLRTVLPPGQPIGACFMVDPVKKLGCIYLDFGSPLGILAPFLVHEITHALDAKVWAGDVKKARQVMLETEASAFHAQHLFTQELRERDPDYETFLRAAFPKARILHELLEPAEIDALYADDEKKAA